MLKGGDSAGIEAGEVKDMLFADFDPSDPSSCFVISPDLGRLLE
jgi:hypothetical protein